MNEAKGPGGFSALALRERYDESQEARDGMPFEQFCYEQGRADTGSLCWRVTAILPPPVNVPLIGYDEFYHRIGECFWDGDPADDGSPHLEFVDSDDCRITHWQPMPGKP